MLRNTDAETTECYEIIYELVKAPAFRNNLIDFVNILILLHSAV